MSNNGGPDPIDNPMFEPVQEETRYKVLSKLLDEKLMKMTSYIKDDRDRGKLLMNRAQKQAYLEVMGPLMKASKQARAEGEAICKIFDDQAIGYLEGMMIRKGWRPEQIAAILAAEEKAKRRASMGMFDDDQQKGVDELRRLKD